LGYLRPRQAFRLAMNHIDVDLAAVFQQVIDDRAAKESLPIGIARFADEDLGHVA